ncbi:MAG: mechanosensitive ion channel family protein [Pseudomonadales bacterium]|nr:mechanosensitive ion channel family protein [Pseudomonadales bacterium]
MEAVMEMLSELNSGQWRWGWQVLLVVMVTLIGNFILTRLMKRLQKRLERTANLWDDTLLAAAKTPANIMVLVLGLSIAANIGNAYIETELFTEANLNLIRRLAVIGMVAVSLVRFISIVEQRLISNFELARVQWGENVDVTTLTAIAKLLRLSVAISALLVILPTLGIEITALLAFGGVGGIAVGFAAKDLLANFFGGLTIYLDRPFAIGDWIRSPDREIEGTVEKIGWRLTVVRTFDKRPLYIPNSVFASIALENPSRMLNRRIHENIGVRYQDADKLQAIIEDVRKMLENHPDIDSTQTLMVNFNKFAASSLEFFVYTFTKTTVWVEYHKVKQDVLMKIVEIVLAHDAEFAFPTTTIDGLDPNLFRSGEQTT